MNKKVISLILATLVSSTLLVSCGKAKTPDTNSNTQDSSVSEQNEKPKSPDAKGEDSSIIGENNKPTVEVKQIATVADFKDKDKQSIEKILGKATKEENTVSTYEKDNYTFEITYIDSKCGKIKILPKTTMKYPADGTNILKLLGINAKESDEISPAGLKWNNKFDTSKIEVVSNNEPDGKISYVEITLK